MRFGTCILMVFVLGGEKTSKNEGCGMDSKGSFFGVVLGGESEFED